MVDGDAPLGLLAESSVAVNFTATEDGNGVKGEERAKVLADGIRSTMTLLGKMRA